MAAVQGRGTACPATFVLALVVVALCCCTASATVWTVGDSSGWRTGVNYTTWAEGKAFKIGDVLFFPYAQSTHDVEVVNKTEYDSCTWSSTNGNYTTGNTNITLNATGTSYYLCSFPTHCSAGGMRLAVNVVAATSPPPAPAPAPSSPSPTVWTVGGSSGWNIGPNYTTWASGKTFKKGDVLFFPYAQSNHDVVVVNKTEYDSCTSSSTNANYTAGNTNITLATGSSYYLCSFPTHCTSGMRLAVNVVAAGTSPTPAPGSPSPSPAPGSAPTKAPASSPTNGPTPSPASTATPPPSSPASTAPGSTTTPGSGPPGPPGSTSSPSPPAPAPSSAPSFHAAAGGVAAVLSILLGATLLL